MAYSRFLYIFLFDGEEALEVMDREHVDLIISDIMMPKMGGYELTKLLRDTSYNLPILMVAVKGQLEDMEKGFVAGTDDYMIKPINLKEMFLRVKALLRRAQLENKKHIKIGNTELNYAGLTVTVKGETHEIHSLKNCIRNCPSLLPIKNIGQKPQRKCTPSLIKWGLTPLCLQTV